MSGRRARRVLALPIGAAALAVVVLTTIAVAARLDVTAKAVTVYEAAVTVPGPSFVKHVGSATCSGGTTQAVAVPGAGVAAGNTLVVRVYNRPGNAGTVSATDSAGNTYAVDVNRTLASSGRLVLLSAHVTTALSSGNTITVTFPGANDATSVAVDEFTGITSSSRVDVANSATGSGSSASAGLTTTVASTLVLGALGLDTATTVSEPAQFAALTRITFGCGGGKGTGTNHAAYRIVSATGANTYNPSLGANVNWIDDIVAYKGA